MSGNEKFALRGAFMTNSHLGTYSSSALSRKCRKKIRCEKIGRAGAPQVGQAMDIRRDRGDTADKHV